MEEVAVERGEQPALRGRVRSAAAGGVEAHPNHAQDGGAAVQGAQGEGGAVPAAAHLVPAAHRAPPAVVVATAAARRDGALLAQRERLAVRRPDYEIKGATLKI